MPNSIPVEFLYLKKFLLFMSAIQMKIGEIVGQLVVALKDNQMLTSEHFMEVCLFLRGLTQLTRV